jgi:hypothetical protein
MLCRRRESDAPASSARQLRRRVSRQRRRRHHPVNRQVQQLGIHRISVQSLAQGTGPGFRAEAIQTTTKFIPFHELCLMRMPRLSFGCRHCLCILGNALTRRSTTTKFIPFHEPRSSFSCSVASGFWVRPCVAATLFGKSWS